jgi:hypothetical protein
MLGACGNSNKKSTSPATAPGPAALKGMNVCVTCHTAIVADWITSKHANLDPTGSLDSPGVPTLAEVTGGSGCADCHDPNTDSANIIDAGIVGSVARPVIGCEACHGFGSLHADSGGAGAISLLSNTTGTTIGSVPVSGQFVMCTSCHELLDTTGTGTVVAAHDPASSVAPTDIRFVITDTHFATPGDFTASFDGATGGNKNNITGYAMDYTRETICTDCHNPHRTAEINREWALSAHADKFGGYKADPATEDPLEYFSGAWAHYNWSCDAANCGTAGDRRSCQRCHTTSGFGSYADALRTNNAQTAANIRQGLVSSLTYTSGFKPEMLKCNGCHVDNRGTLRNPGAITANYDYPVPIAAGGRPYALASHAYPDVHGSNVCMTCHTGRESGETVKGLNDPELLSKNTISFFDFSKLGFINSHYLTAGGTVFTSTGFEFDGRSYANLTTYRHINIGSSAAPNTGTDGPCVGCHMSRPGNVGNHLFLPVTRSTVTAGEVIGVASQVCIFCHTVSGAGGLEELLNERKREFREAIEATISILDKRGFYFRAANPYFFKLRTASTSTIKVSVTQGNATVTGINTLWSTGAAPVSSAATSTVPDYFKVDSDGTYYRIASVIDDVTLTLEQPYAGASLPSADFSIIQGGSSGGVKNWLTQAGSGFVPAAVGDTKTDGTITGRLNMGAAFNLNLLEHDPGAYAHNRIYAKRLLYDAIDWADDNQMNYSVGTTLTAACNVGTPPLWCTGALEYLLPNGIMNGVAAERP